MAARKKAQKSKKLSEAAEQKLAALENLETQYTETIERLVFEANNLVTERPGGHGWELLTDERHKGITEPDHRNMIEQARKLYRSNSHAHGAIETMVHYIIGRGIEITPKSEDVIIKWIFREFWTAPRNMMELKQFEIIRRVLRDGELFIEFFENNDNGKVTIRFIDPLDLKNPSEAGKKKANVIAGIEFKDDDIETKISYNVHSRLTGNDRIVPAERILHIKPFADSDSLRGDSWLLPSMRMFTLYKQWLDARIMLNRIRTSIALIKKIKGGTSDVDRLRGTLSHAQPQRSGETKREGFRAGSMITANAGVEYDFISPNINASDVADDGRAMKLDMSAALNLPEYVFGDSSNANYASTLVAEAPFVKGTQYWQKFFEYAFSEIGRKVIEAAVRAGMIKEPNDDEFFDRLRGLSDLNEQEDEEEKNKLAQELMPNGKVIPPSETFYGFDIQWPEIIHRNVKEFTESLVVARNSGWISDSTAAGALGYSYEEEVRKQNQIEDEAKVSPNPLAGKGPDDVEDETGRKEFDDESSDLLNGLSDEEKEQLMKSNDPADIARLIISKLNTSQPKKKPEVNNGNQ